MQHPVNFLDPAKLTSARIEITVKFNELPKNPVTIPKNNTSELYFEESDIEAFVEKLEKYYPSVQYVNRLMMCSWGQRVVRFYDPDGNLIEVGTPM